MLDVRRRDHGSGAWFVICGGAFLYQLNCVAFHHLNRSGTTWPADYIDMKHVFKLDGVHRCACLRVTFSSLSQPMTDSTGSARVSS